MELNVSEYDVKRNGTLGRRDKCYGTTAVVTYMDE